MDKLVQKCLAPDCNSTTDQPGISFFDFPSEDRELIRSWNKALGFRANCKHIPDPKVCDRHFLPEEIDRNVVPAVLTRPDAVPSVGVISSMDDKPGPTEVMTREGSGSEASYCRLCAKDERQPLKNNLEKLMKCSDTAKLLDICLESSRKYDMLPSGVCDACAHMMKFWIKFVRTCSAAQIKLVKMLGVIKNDDEEDCSKLDTEAVVATQIKREDEEPSEIPTDYLVVGLGKDEKSLGACYDISEETEFGNDVQKAVEKLEHDHAVKEEPLIQKQITMCRLIKTTKTEKTGERGESEARIHALKHKAQTFSEIKYLRTWSQVFCLLLWVNNFLEVIVSMFLSSKRME